jgi:hypothetical protein
MLAVHAVVVLAVLHTTLRVPLRAPITAMALTASEQYAEQLLERRHDRQAEAESDRASDAVATAHRAAALRTEAQQVEARYADALEAFDGYLYPPSEYGARNGASRTDGYWPYVSKGEEPPLAYGEFPLPLFSRLVDRACALAGLGEKERGEA